MNIYFLNSPNVISDNVWNGLLNVLDIDTVIDLISYKPTAVEHPSCYNKIFNSITEKYCLQKMLPSNFLELSREDKYEKHKKTINRIWGRMIEKSKKYNNKESISRGATVYSEKEKGNILVLCLFGKQNSLINYCATYFCGAIKNQKICDIGFIDLYKLDFIYRESEVYNKHRSGEWHDDFSYDTQKRIKICEKMDSIFSKLENEFNISENGFYKEKFIEKIKANKKRHDMSVIESILEKEEERWSEEMSDMERSNAEDELRSWDEDFPGWRSNID